MRRPTALRVALENAQVSPSTSKDIMFMVAKRIPESLGYVTYRPRKEYSDGPRPKGAGPITMFDKEHTNV